MRECSPGSEWNTGGALECRVNRCVVDSRAQGQHDKCLVAKPTSSLYLPEVTLWATQNWCTVSVAGRASRPDAPDACMLKLLTLCVQRENSLNGNVHALELVLFKHHL